MAMPKMSGDQLAAELIKVRKDIPILLCTGHSDTIDEKKAKKIGIKGFAMKPLDKGKLARAVRTLGSSQAGPIAITYAVNNPERVSHLILYGTYARGKDLGPEEVQTALVNLVKASWGLGSRTLAEIFVPDADKEQLKSLGRFQRTSSTPEIAAKLMEYAYKLDVSNKLSDVKTETLVLHREGDKVITIEQGRNLAREIPNARFKVLKGNIHPWWYGESDNIAKEVHMFLQVEGTAEGGVSQDGHKDISSNKVSDVVEQATIVFSDIESSTELVTRLGDHAAREIFLKHDAIVRTQLNKYRGRELQNLGDGFMLSFETASNAIKCSKDIQKEISKELPEITVRIGVHTGEVVRREGRHPFGRAVVLASRFLSQARGGQILTSDVTRQIVSGNTFEFSNVGSFKPKGFEEYMDLHEVSWSQVGEKP
jgi:class 3 adenylate cyclase